MGQPNFSAIRQSILEQVAANRLPSFVAAAACKGEILWEEAFGWADREKQAPASLDTIYPVASVSKSITATGLMILAERGLVDLDAPVTRYLEPGVFAGSEYSPDEVTARHLLNMNAGIPHLWKYEYSDAPERSLSTGQLVRQYGFRAAQPGKRHMYSNLSYGVIELLIASAAGRPFGDFMREALFAPLGMEHTSLKMGIRPGSGLSTAYDAENHSVPWDFCLRPDGGAGFYSTGRDLLRYALFHLQMLDDVRGRVLSPEALDRLHRELDQRAPNYRVNPISGYAMGWGIVEDGQYVSLWSNGAMLGCSAMVMLVPAEGTAAVCLSNYTSPDSISDQKAIEITGAMLPGFAENLQAGIAALSEAEAQGQPEAGFFGMWSGAAALQQGEIPITLNITRPAVAAVRVGSQPETMIEDAHFNGTFLEGRAVCAFPLDETLHQAHSLYFELYLDGDRLTGAARAESSGDRPHFGLPYYVTLNRQR